MKFKMMVVKPVTDRLTPTCEDITYLISKSMDTKISFQQKLQIKIHILGCILCHRYQDQLRKIQKAIKKSVHNYENDATQQKDTLSPESYSRIKSSINERLSE